MPQTPKLRHPYPDQNRRDWYDSFVSFANSLDAADFASRDERNVGVVLTGILSFTNIGSGFSKVSWDAPIEFFHGTSGFKGTLPANLTGIDLEDGDAVYVNVTRGPTGPYDLVTTKTVSGLPTNDQATLLFWRTGSILWIRQHGFVDIGGATGNMSGKVLASIPLVVKQTQGNGLITMGRIRLNYSDWALPGAVTFRLRVEAQNTATNFNSDIHLYDVDTLSGDTLLASFDINLDDQPIQLEAAITPLDTITDRVYELRAGLEIGGPGSPYLVTDEIIVWNAALEIVHT